MTNIPRPRRAQATFSLLLTAALLLSLLPAPTIAAPPVQAGPVIAPIDPVTEAGDPTPVGADGATVDAAAAATLLNAPDATALDATALDGTAPNLPAPIVEPPAAPVPLAPAGEATTTGLSHPPLGLPTLIWTTVPGASLYQLQVDRDGGFGDPLNVETRSDRYSMGVQATSTQLAWGDGAFFWRVRAGTRAGAKTLWSPFSETYRFFRNWDADGALKPTLLSPPQGVTRTAFQPGDFSWTPVPGAARYLFQIAEDNLFTSLVYQASTLTTALTPKDRLFSRPFYWRVLPQDSFGNLGTSSDVGLFTFDWSAPPVLLAPPDKLDTPFTPRFSWTAVPGARAYVLEIRSVKTNGSSEVTEYRTYNTDFTPVDALGNDQDYYWRVRAVTEARANTTVQGIVETTTAWSPTRNFRMRWNFAPQLLSPEPLARVSYPVFHWAPVPGIEKYEMQIDESNSLAPPLMGEKAIFNAAGWAQPEYPNGLLSQFYSWRVRGVDAQGNYTPWSDTSAFAAEVTTAASPVYPPFYYAPDNANMPVRKDVSVAWPLFLWDTAHNTTNFPINGMGLTVAPHHYRLTVDDTYNFSSPVAQIDTSGLGAALTLSSLQSPLVAGTLYYWKVQSFADAAGAQEFGYPATWKFRYDPSLPELPFATAPTPIQPPDRFEAVGDPPALGWLPHSLTARTRVQVSSNPEFSALVDEELVTGAHYVPWQGRTERMPPGAYWWRFRFEDASGAPLSGYSAAWRFHLSAEVATGNFFDMVPPPAPSTLLSTTATYLPEVTRVASSPPSAGDLDLRDLHVATDRLYTGSHAWVIAFGAAAEPSQPVEYTIYIDADHLAGSGGTSHPVSGAPLPANAHFLPEYLIIVPRTAMTVLPTQVLLYTWNANVAPARWNVPQSLTTILGNGWFDADTDSVQLVLPYQSLGSGGDDWTGSLAIVVASAGTGTPDLLPPQPAGPYSRPVFVSEMLTPLYPFDTPFSNPRVLHDMPLLRWRTPYFGSTDGYRVQVARDLRFTEIVFEWDTFETRTYSFFQLLPAAMQVDKAFMDNETYYWRVSLRHERWNPLKSELFDVTAWSSPMRFKLASRLPGNPRLTTGVDAFMTPTFLWDRVEGAAGYRFQLALSPTGFDAPLIDLPTDATSFTPSEISFAGAIKPNVTYYWRVAIRRTNSILGEWTPVQSFVKSSLMPTMIAPLDGSGGALQAAASAPVIGQPTFTWAPMVSPAGEARMAAPTYRLLVDDDPNFGSPFINEVTQSTSYTPPQGKSLRPGAWRWKVALVDGPGNTGPFAPTSTFSFAYAAPMALSPTDGAGVSLPPTLSWTPIAGAAYYKVEFSTSETMSPSIRATTYNASYTPTSDLKAGRFFWHAQMFDADNNPGPIVAGRFIYGSVIFLPITKR